MAKTLLWGRGEGILGKRESHVYRQLSVADMGLGPTCHCLLPGVQVVLRARPGLRRTMDSLVMEGGERSEKYSHWRQDKC